MMTQTKTELAEFSGFSNKQQQRDNQSYGSKRRDEGLSIKVNDRWVKGSYFQGTAKVPELLNSNNKTA
jgi:hypothetical protein